MTTKILPESLTIKLEFTVDREYLEEVCLENDETLTFQKMLDMLREHALESIDDDAYNMVNGADVFDENGDQVC
jgi:hypothetical protein